MTCVYCKSFVAGSAVALRSSAEKWNATTLDLEGMQEFPLLQSGPLTKTTRRPNQQLVSQLLETTEGAYFWSDLLPASQRASFCKTKTLIQMLCRTTYCYASLKRPAADILMLFKE